MSGTKRQGGGKFAPGSSGNLNGRPRKARSVDAAVLQALREPVTVTENGQRRRVPKLDAAAKQLVNKGASGDLRATKLALDLAQKAEERIGQAAVRAPIMTASDREIADRVIARLRRILEQESSNVESRD